MASQIAKLEKSLVDLGAEMFKLRYEMAEMRDFHAHVMSTVSGLRALLQNKGAITINDLDAMNAGIDPTASDPFDQQIEEVEQEIWARKKPVH